MKKLKPCPFCGGIAEVEIIGVIRTDNKYVGGYIARCKSCRNGTHMNMSKTEAIDLWNQRV